MPKIKYRSGKNTVPANPSKLFVGPECVTSLPAHLRADDECSGSVFLVATEFEGRAPMCAQIFGDSDLLAAAWKANRPTLTLFGTKVRVDVRNMSIKTGALIINSAQIFRVLAALTKSPSGS